MALTFTNKIEEYDRLTLRMLSRDKFGIELFARMKRKTISAVIKEALDQYMGNPDNGFCSETDDRKQVSLLDLCWDPIAADRFVKIATNAPNLLSNQEMVRWKIITEDAIFWMEDATPDVKKIRESWNDIETKANQLLQSNG